MEDRHVRRRRGEREPPGAVVPADRDRTRALGGTGGERDVLVADTAHEFAAHVVRLCTDAALWHRLAARAHDCLAPFSPAAVKAALDTLLALSAAKAALGES